MKAENICISFGENCLTDDILKRYNIKSYSTPYSPCRSNIEYILQIEEDSFRDFLNPEYIKFEKLDNKLVLRLAKYDHIENTYYDLCMNGFEFTHHDVVNNQNHYEAFKRRYLKLLNKKDENVYIFYHHRYCEKTDIKMLIEHLSKLKNIYKNRCRKIEIIMFTQNIVNEMSERKVTYMYKNGVHVYTLCTLNVWGGVDQNIFWGRCDEDLIGKMMTDIMRKFKLGSYVSIFGKIITFLKEKQKLI